MASKIVNIAGIGPVNLCKRRGNRNLRLSLGVGGEVRVSMPPWLPYKTGEQFALSRIDWITANRTEAPQILQSGDGIGKAHRLYFRPYDADKITSRVQGSELTVSHPPDLLSHHPSVQQVAITLCTRALRREAENLLPQRLHQLAARTGMEYASVQVRLLKSRWGSCSSRAEITLNLYLMQLPWHLIDYVIIHELTHTRVMRHGPPFWDEITRHLPNARALRKEIAIYSPAIKPRKN